MFFYEFSRFTILIIILHQTSVIHISHGFKKALTDCRCGQEGEDIKGRVKGGSVLRPMGHPSLAMISYVNSFVCGGSVVGPHHVLTAAHCLMDVFSFEVLKVYLGLHDRLKIHSTNVRKYDVRQVIKHEKFTVQEGNNLLINDIALLVVDKIEFNKYIQPICLPFNLDISKFKAAAVAGWGLTEYRGRTSNLPKVAVLSLLTNSECQKSALGGALTQVPDIFDMVLCAYKRKTDACQGDSGGPLYWRSEDDITYQIGIVSFGVKCGSPGMPGLYSRLTTYMDWLDTQLDGDYCSVPT